MFTMYLKSVYKLALIFLIKPVAVYLQSDNLKVRSPYLCLTIQSKSLKVELLRGGGSPDNPVRRVAAYRRLKM